MVWLEHEGHTAYASRSPLASDESWVGAPRVVEGLAAQMDSIDKVNGLYVNMMVGEEDYLPFVIDI